jgi:predicted 2-oxoglutarate/Fe(II)-dependent dioxygenase YbiX
LTTVIVLSDNFKGGEFALTEDKSPSFHFENLDGIETFNLKLGDSISFNGSKTYHGVLPVTEGVRYALNVWMTETNFDYPKLKNNKSII